jgi:hypothetical protein
LFQGLRAASQLSGYRAQTTTQPWLRKRAICKSVGAACMGSSVLRGSTRPTSTSSSLCLHFQRRESSKLPVAITILFALQMKVLSISLEVHSSKIRKINLKGQLQPVALVVYPSPCRHSTENR